MVELDSEESPSLDNVGVWETLLFIVEVPLMVER